jgi:glycosyltransferase involved in cell wall biosynthesis
MSNYCIRPDYISRTETKYKDMCNRPEIYQRKVYELARQIAVDQKLKTIADIGCGGGQKLLEFMSEFDTVGIDLEPTVRQLRQRYPNRRWKTPEEITSAGPADMVICADVIEHVLNPDEIIRSILRLNPKVVVISTPDRDYLVKKYQHSEIGPPKSEFHIREWSRPEFHAYMSQYFAVVHQSLFENVDQYSQMMVCTPKMCLETPPKLNINNIDQVSFFDAGSTSLTKSPFSIFSITNGQESFQYSLQSLKDSWGRTEEIKVFRDMNWLDAVNACITHCDTPYFFRVDDDFILHPQAIAYMRQQVLNLPHPERMGIYYCHLWEDWMSRVRASIKIYNAAALRAIGGFKCDEQGKVDLTTNALLQKAGYDLVKDMSVVALHACGSWDEQLKYEQMWSQIAATPYEKPTREQMKRYCKPLDEQYAMRTRFLEGLNEKNRTLFHHYLNAGDRESSVLPRYVEIEGRLNVLPQKQTEKTPVISEQRITKPSRGIVYVAFGREYERIAAYTACYSRRFTDLPFCVFTNSTDRDPKWNEVSNVSFRVLNETDDINRSVKTSLPLHTPFDETIYLDVDAVLRKPGIERLFSLLEQHDLVFNEIMKFRGCHTAFFQKYYKPVIEKLSLLPRCLASGALFAFRKTDFTRQFFDRWNDLWCLFGKTRDMPALMGAVETVPQEQRHKLFIMPLECSSPRFLNFHPHNGSCVDDEAAIIHHRFEDPGNTWYKRYGIPLYTMNKPWDQAPEQVRMQSGVSGQERSVRDSTVKPQVLMFVDKPGWAHDFKTDQIVRYLSDEFEFRKHYCDQAVRESDIEWADLIVIYYWRAMRSQSLKKVWHLLEQNRHKVLMGICSHVEMEGDLKEPGMMVIKALAGAVFANSRLLYNAYAQYFDVPVYYTPNGVDTTLFTPADQPVRNAKLTVGWAGSLTTNGGGKGYHEFIVPAAKAAGVEVLAAAREDCWRTQEQMLEFYRKIDLYVCASLNEGTPNPCLEAAACGVPILTTRVGNMPELIEPGVNGYFVERDMRDIAEKLRMLRDDPELLNHLRSNARKAVLSWDWKVNAENYRKMFRERMQANENAPAERKTVPVTPESLPLVSVIVPTHNRPDMLKYAIASILNQTYPNVEIVVVNDAGQPVDDVVAGLNMRGNIVSLRHETNKGLAAARNTGLRAARGKYVCYLDDDDLFFRDHVKMLVTALETSEYKAAHTNAVRSLQVQKDGKYVEVDRTVPYTRAVNHDDLLVQNMVPVLCVMHEKACLEKTGFFDETLKTHEDWDFWIRMSKYYRFKHIPEVTSLVTWREDGTTMSSSKREEFRKIPERIYARYRDWAKDKPDVKARQAARLRMLGAPVSDVPVQTAAPVQAAHAEVAAAVDPIGSAPGRRYKIAVKFCTPSQKHRNWGDTWFARGLQRAFIQAGHDCVIHSREEWDQPDDDIDIAIHLKGLAAYNPKPHCFNVIWLISHPELHTADELNRFDAVFCGSKKYLEHIKPELTVPYWYLPQAADTTVFAPIEKAPEQDIDLLFVGSNYYQNKNRKIVADVLATGRDYNLWIVGPFWKGHVDEKYIKAQYVLPEKLAELYARTKIVLNDHHDTMKQWGFVNDRTYSLAASKVFQISDDVDGLEELGVVTYRTVEDLREKIDFYLANESERLQTASAVHERCKAFSFDHTAQRMLQGVGSQWTTRAGKREQVNSIQTEASAEALPITPKVSIVMSCHNAERYLSETLNSLLAQTLTEWELLVIDDGSTDQTLSILKSYADKDRRIRLWRFEEKRGPYIRRNFAIRQGRAEFVSIQDSDDLMHPDKLKDLYECINSNLRLAIVGSYHRRFRETFRGADFGDAVLRRIEHSEIMQGFKQSWYLGWHGSAIIRKNLFGTIGLYDEQPYGSDTFWLAKAGLYSLLTRKIEFRNVPKFLTYKREHRQSQTGTISPADPRNRRHYLEKYYISKLTEIAQNAVNNPNMDAAAALKACTCTEFIPVFGHLFEKWESEPVTEEMCRKMLERAAAQFSAELYVSCLITLDRLEQMTEHQSGTWRNMSVITGLAAYASGEDEFAVACLRNESQKNQLAAELLRRIENGTLPSEAGHRRREVKEFMASNRGAISVEVPSELSELTGGRSIRSIAAGSTAGNGVRDRQSGICGARV